MVAEELDFNAVRGVVDILRKKKKICQRNREGHDHFLRITP